MKKSSTLNHSIILIITLLLTNLSAYAKVYQCTDKRGQPLFTGVPTGNNCKLINTNNSQFSSISAPNNTSNNTNPSTNNENRTSQSNENNNNSQQIIAAQQQVNNAKKALEEGKKVRYGNERNYAKYLERIQGLENNVKQSEDNLKKLQQQ